MPASNEYQPVVGQPGQSPPSTRAATYSSTTITAQAAVSVGAVVVAAPEEGVGVRDSVQAGLELIGEFAGGQPAKFNPKEFRVELVGETRVSTGHIGPRTV